MPLIKMYFPRPFTSDARCFLIQTSIFDARCPMRLQWTITPILNEKKKFTARTLMYMRQAAVKATILVDLSIRNRNRVLLSACMKRRYCCFKAALPSIEFNRFDVTDIIKWTVRPGHGASGAIVRGDPHHRPISSGTCFSCQVLEVRLS